MGITSLPPGFRFHPTDVELVKYYLKRKVLGKKLASDVIAEVDVYKNEPWDLPDKSYLPSRDLKWYFYCPREKKYSRGGRINRATERGYWKTTGKDRPVIHNANTVGMIKTLIFHIGRAPNGDRTDWVMHEYRLDEKDLADRGVNQEVFVLCMIFQKEGPGPRNGAQYGAPFKEDDWSDDEDNGAGRALSESQPAPVKLLPSQTHSAVTTGPVSEIMCSASTSDCRQEEILPSVEKLLPVAENNDSSTLNLSQIQEDGDFLSMLDLDQEDHGPEPTEKNENEQLINSNQDKDVVPACTDGSDIFEDLGDLWSFFGRSENEACFAGDHSAAADYTMDQIWAATTAGDPGAFILLSDLDTPLSSRSSELTSTNAAHLQLPNPENHPPQQSERASQRFAAHSQQFPQSSHQSSFL